MSNHVDMSWYSKELKEAFALLPKLEGDDKKLLMEKIAEIRRIQRT